MSADLSRALILVDVQNDFCEGGSLPVPGGADVALRISDHVVAHADDYGAIVATADWHEDPGAHFSDHPDYVDTWPAHCRVGSDGALFHPGAERAFEHVEAIFRKGQHAAAWATGCATGRSSRSTSPASPPTTACGPPRSTHWRRASTPASCSTSPR